MVRSIARMCIQEKLLYLYLSVNKVGSKVWGAMKNAFLKKSIAHSLLIYHDPEDHINIPYGMYVPHCVVMNLSNFVLFSLCKNIFHKRCHGNPKVEELSFFEGF